MTIDGVERDIPRFGELWRHFKGDSYYIICTAVNATNGSAPEEFVVYRKLSTNQNFICELKEFLSAVDVEKYPDAKQKWRFECVWRKANHDD